MSHSILMCRKGTEQGSIPDATTQFILKMRMDAIGATGGAAAPGPQAVASGNIPNTGPDSRLPWVFHRDAPKALCLSAQPVSQTWQKEHQQ
ncbi:hypothetical protein [Rhizobium sp. GR12]|uniref:hypothetical protein n=1 Tax=Rhizobium sp. GR12 TaxID=3053925 RepID=UPI002FBE77C5